MWVDHMVNRNPYIPYEIYRWSFVVSAAVYLLFTLYNVVVFMLEPDPAGEFDFFGKIFVAIFIMPINAVLQPIGYCSLGFCILNLLLSSNHPDNPDHPDFNKRNPS